MHWLKLQNPPVGVSLLLEPKPLALEKDTMEVERERLDIEKKRLEIEKERLILEEQKHSTSFGRSLIDNSECSLINLRCSKW